MNARLKLWIHTSRKMLKNAKNTREETAKKLNEIQRSGAATGKVCYFCRSRACLLSDIFCFIGRYVIIDIRKLYLYFRRESNRM